MLFSYGVIHYYNTITKGLVKMKTLTKLTHIVSFLLLITVSKAFADQALYKRLPLNNIYHLAVDGNITIDVLYGETEQAEIYLRKNAINKLIISLEQLNSPIDDTWHRLRIREEPNFTANKNANSMSNEDKAIAHIVLSVNKLKYIYANELHQLSIKNGYTNTSNKLSIRIDGDSHSYINTHVERLEIDSRTTSKTTLADIIASNLKIKAAGTSEILVDNSEIKQQEVELQNKALFQQNNTHVEHVKIKTRSLANILIDESNEYQFAKIEARNSSTIIFKPTGLTHLNIDAKNQAKLTLSDSDKLMGKARNNAQVTYLTTNAMNTDITQFKQYQTAQFIVKEISHE